jgi:hypothetical protein
MLRKLGMLTAASAMAIGFGLGHGTHTFADPGNGKNCVGSAVSSFAQSSGGLGDTLHDAGQNPGQTIQQFATLACGKHA